MTNIDIGKWKKAQMAYAEKEKITLQRGGTESRHRTQVFACTRSTNCASSRAAAHTSLMAVSWSIRLVSSTQIHGVKFKLTHLAVLKQNADVTCSVKIICNNYIVSEKLSKNTEHIVSNHHK